ncbi:MAG: 23S rRNA (guanosine(2251)-2'-O)-methyltransferase RlmB [Firmicutes bacterium]|nr:23S rRNA (guanosine(2251)-2'-O)-methyltransferase RlmB [Bacillota bacterium]
MPFTDNPNTDRDDLIEGRNAVLEAIRAGRPIDKLYIARGETDRALSRVAAAARAAGITVVDADRRKLDQMSLTGAHQGAIALAAVREYASVADILALAAQRGEPPFVIVCDEISDPHNLGAILRTADCAGAHGVILPKRRSAGLSTVVDKVSAGAAEHVLTARVPNLSAAIRELKNAGLWVFGSDAEGAQDLWQADLSGAICLVVGSEGEGMGRLVKENCDLTLRIPLRGRVSSLNASAAAAVLMYEALRQRMRL